MARNQRAVVAILFLSFWVLPSSSPAQPPMTQVDPVGSSRQGELRRSQEAGRRDSSARHAGRPREDHDGLRADFVGPWEKEQARQFLNTLPGGQQSSRRKGHSAGPATAGTLLPIYAAWLKALDGQADAAIKTLEKMLQQAGGAQRGHRRGRRRAGHALHGPWRAGEGEEGRRFRPENAQISGRQ